MTSAPARAQLDRLWRRGRDFLGTEVAIMGGAMTWVSERNLVAAISNAGGFGVIACGAMTPELLDAEIGATRALTTKPFGVNLITMHPDLFELIVVCAKHEVTHVALAGGIPPKASACFSPAPSARYSDLMKPSMRSAMTPAPSTTKSVGTVSTPYAADA